MRLNVRQQFASLTYLTAGSGSGSFAPHGGHVTGIISGAASTSFFPASYNGTPTNLGVAGGCPNCSVIYSGVLPDLGVSEFANAITGLVDRGVQVINLSANANSAGTDCPVSDVTATAIAYAVSRDVLFVNSSGNQNSALGANYPSNCSGALAVGAAQTASPASPGSGWTRWTFGGNSGSNYTQGGGDRGVIAPGRSIVSTYNAANTAYIGTPWYCGSSVGYDEGATGDAFGTCTGTSMAAPHVAALAGVMRSASPLTSQATVQNHIRGASRQPNGTQSQNDEFGYGMPKAGLALDALIPAGNPQNRLTPLFSFYSSGREDYFYTTVPQMGRAARYGTLQPQPNVPANYAYSDTQGYGSYSYASVGNLLNIYLNFPGTPWYWTAGAQAWLFTTPENPINAYLPLVPLFRLSFACNHPQYSNASSPTACAANPNHTDTTYTTEIAGVDAYVSVGYRLDGVEGYLYPKSQSQPTGTVRLMRKFHPSRDDHAIFPETELSNMTNQGYTDNSGSDWLGYVYPNTNGAVPTIQQGARS